MTRSDLPEAGQLPPVLARADLRLVFDVYDHALDGLLRVDPHTADERRGLLHDLYGSSAGEPSVLPGCPVPAAALLAFAAGGQGSVASERWTLDALAAGGVTLLDVAAAIDILVAAAVDRPGGWHPAVAECLPMASFRDDVTEYRLIAVADLPAWHNPKRSCHRDLWLRHARTIDDGRGLWRALRRRARRAGDPPSWVAGLAAGRWLAGELAAAALEPCARHALSPVQVRSAADRAIRVWETTRPWSRRAALEALGPASVDAPDAESSFAWSLLVDPISWVDGADDLSNGQHRLCALRLAGVSQVLAI